jgi:hypothetical protein
LIENARPQDLTLDGNKRRVAINLELANLARLNLLVNLLNSKHIRVFSRALLQACCCRRVEKPFEPLGMSLPCVFDGAINPYERAFDRGRHCRREVVESACKRVSVYCPNAGIAGQMAAILCIGEHVCGPMLVDRSSIAALLRQELRQSGQDKAPGVSPAAHSVRFSIK